MASRYRINAATDGGITAAERPFVARAADTTTDSKNPGAGAIALASGS